MVDKTQTSTSFSIPEIKDLIVFAREQKVIVMEVAGLRFQFSPLAHDVEKTTEKPTTKTEESPFGHFDPHGE